jgi:putative membrane protein
MDRLTVRNVASQPAWLSAAAVLIIVAGIATANDIGPYSHHMVLHIGLMSGMAPLAAVGLSAWKIPFRASPALLWSVGILQVAALWVWHAPSMHQWLAASPDVAFCGYAVLFGIATVFWACVIGSTGAARWQAIPALMLTGKLVCLLAALLIFAPRLLYHGAHDGHAYALADQQLAGLLMITACPISYLLAALMIAIDLIGHTAEPPPTTSQPASAEP